MCWQVMEMAGNPRRSVDCAAIFGVKIRLERENNALVRVEFAFGNALDMVLGVVIEWVK